MEATISQGNFDYSEININYNVYIVVMYAYKSFNLTR